MLVKSLPNYGMGKERVATPAATMISPDQGIAWRGL